MLKLEGNLDLPFATIYLDDSDELLFYVLPMTPVLRRTGGKAAFKYIKYRTPKPLPNGDVGAALVFMDVELALTPEQEQTVRQRLVDLVKARRGPDDPRPLDPAAIKLTKPQVSKADVLVEVLGDSGNLVQKVNHAGAPSMYGSNVVAMSAELNQFGAPVFEGAMRGQGLGGVRVVYNMTFPAKIPPVTATGTWHASKFYSFVQEVDFEENFWWEDDFSERVSELFANSESRDVVVDPGSLPSTDPEVAKLLQTLRASVTQQLDEAVKRNLLEAIPPESRDFSKIRDEDFENIRRQVTVNKSADVSIRFTENQVVDTNRKPQANMDSLVSQGFKWEEYSDEIDVNDPFFQQLNLTIQVNAPFDTLPIFSVDVSIDYPPETAKSGVKTFTFRKSDDIGKFTAFTNGGPTAFKYRWIVNYEGESRIFDSGWHDHEGDDLKINVDELGLWLVDIEVGDMNFAQVNHAMLTLEHPEVAPGVPPVCRFQIDKEHTKAEIKELLLEPVRPYSGSVKFFMKDGSEFVRQLTDLRGQRFYLDDPFSVTRTVQVRTKGDFERRIDTIFLDLTYNDSGNNYSQTFSVALTKEKRFIDWSFPVIDARAGTVTYRSITTFRDGTSADSGEQTTTERTLLLGEDTATLQVKLVPDLVPWNLVKLVNVELHYSDPANGIDERKDFIFRSGAPEANYELAVRDRTKLSYEWEMTFFMLDGTKQKRKSPAPVTDETLFIELTD